MEGLSPPGRNPAPDRMQKNRELPEWMDKEGTRGDLKFLVLEALEGFTLPKNPFILNKSLTNHAGNLTIPGNSFDNGNKYLLKTRTSAQYEKLQTLTKLLDGTPVSITPHATLNSVQCVIFSPDLKGLTDEEIQQELETQNVKNVRRFWKKANETMVPTNAFLLKIEAPAIPNYIRLGFLQVRTRAYYSRPMVCHNCGKYGHTKVRCQTSPICTNCGAAEHGNCDRPKCCFHCKGDHNLFDRNCPAFKIEEDIIKYKTDNQLSYIEARKIILHQNNAQHQKTYAQISGTTESEKDKIILELSRTIDNLNKQLTHLNELMATTNKKLDVQDKLIATLRKQNNMNSSNMDTDTDTITNSDNSVSSSPSTIRKRSHKKGSSSSEDDSVMPPKKIQIETNSATSSPETTPPSSSSTTSPPEKNNKSRKKTSKQ